MLRSTLIFCAFLCIGIAANAQFVEEKKISDSEETSENQMMQLLVLETDNGTKVSADVKVHGLNPRKPVVLEQISDTTLEISQFRMYTISCVQPGYMYYSEKFWPEEHKTHVQNISLSPIQKGQKTTLNNVQFLGNQTEIYSKSKSALNEVIDFMDANPNVKIAVIGHVNGPDNAHSSKFYHKASLARAEAVVEYFTKEGISKDRLEARGKGNTEMIYPEPKTDWQNDANRRVEIEVIGL